MIETKYICDRCKKEQPTSNQFWVVGIMCNSYPAYDENFTRSRAQWCRSCVNEVGLLYERPLTKEAEKIVSPAFPTIEDMIREIIRSEISTT